MGTVEEEETKKEGLLQTHTHTHIEKLLAHIQKLLPKMLSKIPFLNVFSVQWLLLERKPCAMTRIRDPETWIQLGYKAPDSDGAFDLYFSGMFHYYISIA